jgi:hypothetical protein
MEQVHFLPLVIGEARLQDRYENMNKLDGKPW